MGFFKAALLLCGLLCLTPAAAQTTFPGAATLGPEAEQYVTQQESIAWDLACQAKEINCRAYVKPAVGYTFMEGRFGQYIYGELVVLVEIRLLSQPVLIVVMEHEMIHYLQWIRGESTAGNKNYMTPCAREEEAFRLSLASNAKYEIALTDKRLWTWEELAVPVYGCALQEEKK